MIPNLTDSCVTCSSCTACLFISSLLLFFSSSQLICMRAVPFFYCLANQENLLNEDPLESIASDCVLLPQPQICIWDYLVSIKQYICLFFKSFRFSLSARFWPSTSSGNVCRQIKEWESALLIQWIRKRVVCILSTQVQVIRFAKDG